MVSSLALKSHSGTFPPTLPIRLEHPRFVTVAVGGGEAYLNWPDIIDSDPRGVGDRAPSVSVVALLAAYPYLPESSLPPACSPP